MEFELEGEAGIVDDELARTPLVEMIHQRGKFGDCHAGGYRTLNLFYISAPAKSDIGVPGATALGFCPYPEANPSDKDTKFSGCAIGMYDLALGGGRTTIHETGHVNLDSSFRHQILVTNSTVAIPPSPLERRL